MYVCVYALPLSLQIVGISSLSGKIGTPGGSSYSASKFAMVRVCMHTGVIVTLTLTLRLLSPCSPRVFFPLTLYHLTSSEYPPAPVFSLLASPNQFIPHRNSFMPPLCTDQSLPMESVTLCDVCVAVSSTATSMLCARSWGPLGCGCRWCSPVLWRAISWRRLSGIRTERSR